jgi:glycosyltransferase involved in cell wall biosynthesis
MTPRISLLVLTYNQATVVEAAVQSCLAQVGEPLEIVLSDDASTDGTYALLLEMAAAYRGPHQVRVRRNPQNLGIGAHYNAAIKDSAGQLLVTAAGDDISLPHRVQTLAAAWDASGQKADLLSSHLVDMSADGMDVGTIRVDDLARWKRPEDWVRKRPYVVGASHAFTRRMHERFGPIRADLPYEDQAMALRASCMGGGITVPEALVKYRRGGVSAGATQRLTAEANQKRLQTKYVRQIALYSQIRHDLLIVDREDLWIGRIRKRMYRSQFFVALQTSQGWRSRLQVVAKYPGAGRVWGFLQVVVNQWPRLRLAWSNFRRK